MDTPHVISVAAIVDAFADFLTSAPTLEQISAYHLSDEADQYISGLLEKNRAGHLSQDEVRELDKFVVVEYWMGMVKARALHKLGKT